MQGRFPASFLTEHPFTLPANRSPQDGALSLQPHQGEVRPPWASSSAKGGFCSVFGTKARDSMGLGRE